MDEITKLKETIDDLRLRLREELQLRTELERRCHLLEKLAHRDPSSGLRTESYLRARVQEEIDRSIRYPSATSLVTLCAPRERLEELPKLGQKLMDELRGTDQVFALSNSGLALLLVETPEEGAQQVLERIAAELEQFVSGYGLSVTSFPVDTNLADDFLRMAMDRHNEMAKKIYPEATSVSLEPVSFH